MPLPLPSRAPSGPRRRTLFASAAGAALLVGCSSGPRDTEKKESAGGSPSVTERARARAAGESVGLAERYDAVLAAHPTLTERLAPLRAEVVRHVQAFGGAPKASASGSPSPAPSTSLSPSASASASASASVSPSPAAPATAKEALAALAAAERTLADRRAVALLDVPGELARLLASVAAAGAAHAYLLTEDAR
ncbi:lipoprotein [Streptomyces phaeofaciens JCM 4814]|uniref:Lipoprotein n=1 Tax=Streptomyces phaeofaciens TaxID=68254 RepID=A0A918HIK2_9ACTN|nr:hypothetical protein [Streptomyces phaeofaciens]GGT66888.1 lipoprotein [Streptomyces phaeofaciens]